MDSFTNHSLISHNTFGVDVKCKTFVCLYNQSETIHFVENILDKTHPFLVVGEGSNLLFTNDFEGTIIQMRNKGFEIVDQNTKYVWVKAAAGEKWDDFVAWCVENKYSGAENLSKIPGTVGAAPIQNIGAYGVELVDLFNGLEAVEIANGELKRFYLKELNFGYRDSIFKQSLKNKYIITSVILKLNKFPVYKLDYGNIKGELEKMSYKNLSIGLIRNAISNIRASKLPETKELGNAGSFFKNPIVEKTQYLELRNKFPELVAFPQDNGTFKIAAGWLIEHAGLKGYSGAKVAIHKNQALIVVNLGGASGKEILEFSEMIQSKILDLYGLQLEREVNVID
jgi:UDP-N-acetylmuramate dehydrogenase